MRADLLWKGAILGFSIAAPVGPTGVLAINRTLRGGPAAGLLTGLGAASADAVYGAAAACGLAALAGPFAAAVWLRWAGGLFLLWYGVRLLAARGHGKPPEAPQGSGGSFFSAFLLTLGNPMTILAFAAMLGGFGVAGARGAALSMVAGVFVGSLAWWVVLSSTVALAAARLTGRWFTALDRVCGGVLAAFGLRALLG
jgi:threonine/homoserine/homoserine lactone efflux protein